MLVKSEKKTTNVKKMATLCTPCGTQFSNGSELFYAPLVVVNMGVSSAFKCDDAGECCGNQSP